MTPSSDNPHADMPCAGACPLGTAAAAPTTPACPNGQCAPDAPPTDVGVVVVGLGFSSIPLLRELDARGEDYVIVSEGNTVWEKLEKVNRLDFDLVSSAHTSYYTFEQPVVASPMMIEL